MYKYTVYDENNEELTDLTTTSSIKVTSNLLELMGLKFIQKMSYTLKVNKKINNTIKLTFTEKSTDYKYEIIIPLHHGYFNAFTYACDIKKEVKDDDDTN